MDKSTSNLQLLEAKKLPIIESIEDLSLLTHLSSSLIYNLSRHNSRYYKSFGIKSKNGKLRNICAPKYSMKVLQLWILRNILEYIELHPKAMAYRKGSNYGIKGAAEIHTGAEYLIKTDISNFFNSIDRREIYYFFNNLGYSIIVSNILTDLCTVNNSLPQGAITSPMLSNLIMRKFDEEISAYCDNKEINYTRYADDMIFSTDIRSKIPQLIEKIEELLAKQNLYLNNNKTKILNNFSNRQLVTGIIVNNKGTLHIKRELKYKIRSKIYQEIKLLGKLSSETKGYLAYIKSVDTDRYQYFQEIIKKYKNVLKVT